MISDITSFYDSWKSRYFNCTKCADGSSYRYVCETGSANNLGLTRDLGPSMLITVLMAGYDPQAQSLFNNMFASAKHWQSDTCNYLTVPQVNTDSCNAVPLLAPTSRGQLDIAYSLLLAHRQWSEGQNTSVYLDYARNMIQCIRNNLTRFAEGMRICTNADACVFSFGYMDLPLMLMDQLRAFGTATNDASWGVLINEIYRRLVSFQEKSVQNVWLLPSRLVSDSNSFDFTFHTNADEDLDGSKFGALSVYGVTRLAVDCVTSGDTQCWKVMGRINSYMIGNTQGDPANIGTARCLNTLGSAIGTA